MSRWERELLNAETAGWVRRDTPRSALAIPLDLEEIIGRRWSQERIAELEAEVARLGQLVSDRNAEFNQWQLDNRPSLQG